MHPIIPVLLSALLVPYVHAFYPYHLPTTKAATELDGGGTPVLDKRTLGHIKLESEGAQDSDVEVSSEVC